MTKLKDMPNIPVKLAAEILGKGEQFVRIGLQRGLLPIGVAVQCGEGKKYTFHISYEQLKNYVGEERINNFEKIRSLMN